MSRMRYTLGDVARSLPPEKRMEELRGEWMCALIYRPIGNILTVPLLWLSVRANHVTLTGLVLSLSLPFIALRAPEAGYVAVGLIGMFVATLDCVDGNIARLTGAESRHGRYLDAVTDVVARGCLFAALGILIDQSNPEWMPDFGLLNCLGAALLFYIARLSRLFAEKFGLKESAGGQATSFLDRVLFPFISGLDWATPMLILVAGFFGHLEWVALWLLAFGLLDFLYTQYSVLKRLA